jgi:formyltetrahydrofolate-dependent phosphoribosylglycinamide formyltransferase
MVVLLSGSGRTLHNFLVRMRSGELDAEIPLVISSSSTVKGLDIAREHGIATRVIGRNRFATDVEYGQAMFAAIREQNPHLVVMAGFMKFVPIPDDFTGRVINIHPALIPAFCGAGMYGHHVHEAVLEYGAKVTGCTVHFVDNQYDHGPIILQRTAPVLDDDTPQTLADRVFLVETEAYPAALKLFAEGRLKLDGRRVRVGKEGVGGHGSGARE